MNTRKGDCTTQNTPNIQTDKRETDAIEIKRERDG